MWNKSGVCRGKRRKSRFPRPNTRAGSVEISGWASVTQPGWNVGQQAESLTTVVRESFCVYLCWCVSASFPGCVFHTSLDRQPLENRIRGRMCFKCWVRKGWLPTAFLIRRPKIHICVAKQTPMRDYSSSKHRVGLPPVSPSSYVPFTPNMWVKNKQPVVPVFWNHKPMRTIYGLFPLPVFCTHSEHMWSKQNTPMLLLNVYCSLKFAEGGDSSSKKEDV